MSGYRVIVIGASAGGVEALSRLAAGLPAGLPAAVLVVCHFPPGGTSVLPRILSRSGPLLAEHARDGEPLLPGRIYVAPPDYHLLVAAGKVLLTRGPRENHNRPAIDPLFRSAARAYGRRVIGVVLTGGLHDGTAGLLAIRGSGGIAIVQDPEEAAVAGMPRSALEVAGANYVLSLSQIPPLLAQLALQPVTEEVDSPMSEATDPLESMPEVVDRDMAEQEAGERRGALSVFTCPECGGALWQVDEELALRFRCHVGHAYYGEALLAEQGESLEAALWTAVRIFREKTVLGCQLAARERALAKEVAAQRFEEEARLAQSYADVLLNLLQGYSAAG